MTQRINEIICDLPLTQLVKYFRKSYIWHKIMQSIYYMLRFKWICSAVGLFNAYILIRQRSRSWILHSFVVQLQSEIICRMEFFYWKQIFVALFIQFIDWNYLFTSNICCGALYNFCSHTCQLQYTYLLNTLHFLFQYSKYCNININIWAIA